MTITSKLLLVFFCGPLWILPKDGLKKAVPVGFILKPCRIKIAISFVYTKSSRVFQIRTALKARMSTFSLSQNIRFFMGGIPVLSEKQFYTCNKKIITIWHKLGLLWSCSDMDTNSYTAKFCHQKWWKVKIHCSKLLFISQFSSFKNWNLINFTAID